MVVKQNATLDTSFWINAHRSGLLGAVLEFFTLYYPPAVALELNEAFESGREFWRLVDEGVLTEAVPNRGQVRAFGPGERAAMNLALEHPDWTLLVDDRRPLVEAQRLGLRTICTPVLVTDLFNRGRLTRSEAMLALGRLAALQTVSPALIEAAVTLLGVEGEQTEERTDGK